MAIEAVHFKGKLPIANPEILRPGRMMGFSTGSEFEGFVVIDEDSLVMIGEDSRVLKNEDINNSPLMAVPNNLGSISVVSWSPSGKS